MKIQCPSCDQRLEIPEELAGQTIECPACNESLDVPAMAVKPPAPIQKSEPQVAASERPKSSVLKWAAPVAIIAIVAVGVIMFSPNDPNDVSSSEPTAVKNDGESKMSAPAPETIPDTKSAKTKPPIPNLPKISIHEAAYKNDINAVKLYIKSGVDLNEIGKGKPWEDSRSFAPGTPFFYAVTGRNKEIIELLLSNGVDVNLKNRNGSSPLELAIILNEPEIVKLLIDGGANVNVINHRGSTPLDYVIENNYKNSHTKITDLLRKHGAKTGEELKAEGK